MNQEIEKLKLEIKKLELEIELKKLESVHGQPLFAGAQITQVPGQYAYAVPYTDPQPRNIASN